METLKTLSVIDLKNQEYKYYSLEISVFPHKKHRNNSTILRLFTVKQ